MSFSHWFFRKTKNLRYWIRCHLWDRYHVIVVSNSRNGYTWGWADSDTKMLFACFKILVDYIEKEHAFDVIDWDCNSKHREVKADLDELYNWWINGRATEHFAAYALPVPDLKWSELREDHTRSLLSPEGKDKDDLDAFNAALDALDAKDNSNLVRLISLRNYMWT